MIPLKLYCKSASIFHSFLSSKTSAVSCISNLSVGIDPISWSSLGRLTFQCGGFLKLAEFQTKLFMSSLHGNFIFR